MYLKNKDNFFLSSLLCFILLFNLSEIGQYSLPYYWIEGTLLSPHSSYYLLLKILYVEHAHFSQLPFLYINICMRNKKYKNAQKRKMLTVL